MHRAMKSLPILGETLHGRIHDLVMIHEEDIEGSICDRKAQLIEHISQLIVEELRKQGLSDAKSDFLLDHGPIVQSKIQDLQIRGINVWAE
jgi:hypothetical protein